MQKLKFLKCAVPLVVISTIIALILAIVNAITADRIAENEVLERENAIKSIFPTCDSFEDFDYSSESVARMGSVFDAEKKLIGYYANATPTGFKGEISLMVGIDTEFKIIDVVLISAAETPGVGTKATEKSNLDKFVALDKGEIQKVDTITGATITSKAVRLGIKEAVEAVEKVVTEEK